MKTYFGDREKCYKCYRPTSSCMCKHVHNVKTKTKFVILMHPKEFKKVKNGTGHLTHLALQNSELFVGVDFSNHQKINEIIESHDSYVLYPSKEALNISHTNPHTKKDMAIFIIDSTWSCSLKMLRESKNLQALEHMSFDSTKLSQFKIKQQPAEFCLSTIESTLSVLELLNMYEIEKIIESDLKKFLNPFEKMIEYQQNIIANPINNAVRFKPKKQR
jgi:DTW domain-containing protein YfiP